MQVFRSLRPWPAPAHPQAAFVATSRLCWTITGALLAVTTGLVLLYRLPVHVGQPSLNGLVTLVFAPVAIVYATLRYDARIAGICDGVAVLSSYTLVGAVATYAATVAGAGVPLWDARLLAADHALGFDWRAYLAWLDAHPWLGAVLDGCYRSALLQVAAVILVLGALGQVRRLQTFVLAVQLCLLACIAAPTVMPALGAYAFLHIAAGVDHPHIPLTLMNGAVPQILQLRGPSPVIRLDEIEGIVVFPSFHTMLALLFAWAFWPVPLLRWAALVLNLAMLAATPLSGGHYLVDLAAGAGLGLAALSGAAWLTDRLSRAALLAQRVFTVPAIPEAA